MPEQTLNGDLDLYLNFGFRKRMKYIIRFLNTFFDWQGDNLLLLGMVFNIEYIPTTD